MAQQADWTRQVLWRFILRLVVIGVFAETQTRLPPAKAAAVLCAVMAAFAMLFAQFADKPFSRNALNHWAEALGMILLASLFAALD